MGGLVLADRFDRVKSILGPNGKKPRFDAVVSVTSNEVADAQTRVEAALDQSTKRWKLDETVTNTGKPSSPQTGRRTTNDQAPVTNYQ